MLNIYNSNNQQNVRRDSARSGRAGPTLSSATATFVTDMLTTIATFVQHQTHIVKQENALLRHFVLPKGDTIDPGGRPAHTFFTYTKHGRGYTKTRTNKNFSDSSARTTKPALLVSPTCNCILDFSE
jgi:hypothetical protein